MENDNWKMIFSAPPSWKNSKGGTIGTAFYEPSI
jgi:hypothetical protein